MAPIGFGGRDVILDGELTWGNAGVAYYVFDLPWLDGRDLTPLPLDDRRALLDALELPPPLQRVTLLTDPALETVSGRYWSGTHQVDSSTDSHDPAKAADLWKTSIQLTGLDSSAPAVHPAPIGERQPDSEPS